MKTVYITTAYQTGTVVDYFTSLEGAMKSASDNTSHELTWYSPRDGYWYANGELGGYDVSLFAVNRVRPKP